MKRLKNKIFLVTHAKRIFFVNTKRTKKKRLKKAGRYRHCKHVRELAVRLGRKVRKPDKNTKKKPRLSENIEFLSSFKNLFSEIKIKQNQSGILTIPEIFSLIDNFKESLEFLKELFFVLKDGKLESVELDYHKCKRIDVDASVCMDTILADFIDYIRKCRSLGYNNVYPRNISPINYEHDAIDKVLFSIGSLRRFLGVKIDYPDIEVLPVLINSSTFKDRWQKNEIHTTKIVEYIKKCLGRLNRELPIESETGFYKVIGEIMSNAEEHSTMPNRYAIGFFQETHNDNEHSGIFNFSIFNFGKTIYETFKDPQCLNPDAVQQMKSLSEDFTKNGWIKPAEFEEETLWTLYSLQEGVTSREKKRGNGSIQYINSFFNLKGDMSNDNVSKMLILSGNTRIMFDGTYQITERQSIARKYKMMTFNDSGDIKQTPDKKFVTFAPHYFPGTIITARILIKFDKTKKHIT